MPCFDVTLYHALCRKMPIHVPWYLVMPSHRHKPFQTCASLCCARVVPYAEQSSAAQMQLPISRQLAARYVVSRFPGSFCTLLRTMRKVPGCGPISSWAQVTMR